MGQPIAYDFRIKIVKDHEGGKSLQSIATELGYSLAGVKKIWRAYRAGGRTGLERKQGKSGRRSPFDENIQGLIGGVKDGEQGAPYVRSLLLERYPSLDIPHERTMQRWWKTAGSNRPKGKPRNKASAWSQQVHHTWQIDGKELITLEDGTQVCWMKVVDEASRSELHTGLFPPVPY